MVLHREAFSIINERKSKCKFIRNTENLLCRVDVNFRQRINLENEIIPTNSIKKLVIVIC